MRESIAGAHDDAPNVIKNFTTLKHYILETPRLRLREFVADDAPFIVELVNTPGWLEFIGDKNVRNIQQAQTYLENGPLKSYRENGFGLYLVETRGTPTSIGMCGILKRDSLDNPDLGFAFLTEYTGQGYAFEIATATLKYAMEKFKLSKVFAITKPENKRSIRLLEKLGFKFEKRALLPGQESELLLYCS